MNQTIAEEKNATWYQFREKRENMLKVIEKKTLTKKTQH